MIMVSLSSAGAGGRITGDWLDIIEISAAPILGCLAGRRDRPADLRAGRLDAASFLPRPAVARAGAFFLVVPRRAALAGLRALDLVAVFLPAAFLDLGFARLDRFAALLAIRRPFSLSWPISYRIQRNYDQKTSNSSTGGPGKGLL